MVGGSLHTYTPNTLVDKTTYSDPLGTVPNTNPIILDARGSTLCYGSGAYRFILKDANGVQVFDQDTVSFLTDPSISTAMGPVCAAVTLQAGRDLLGVTSAIATAVASISLLPGPTGPQGATGATGAQGIQGPQGIPGSSAGAPTLTVNANGIAIVFGSNGATMAGQANGVTDGSGTLSLAVTYPVPFATVGIPMLTSTVIGITQPFVVTASSPTGFTAYLATGDLASTAVSFNWSATGY